MKQRLIAYAVTFAFGVCLFMWHCGKSQASGGDGLLGAVEQLRGEQGIILIMKEGERLELQGDQKWQIELAKSLSNVKFALKDVLNVTKSGGQIDNALTIATTCRVMDGLDARYTHAKVLRLASNENVSHKGCEHRLDAWYSLSKIGADVMLRSLDRTYDDAFTANYQTGICQIALRGTFGIWRHMITLRGETQRYPYNMYRDYILRDVSYDGKMSFERFVVDTTLQLENKSYLEDRYDGYVKTLAGVSFLGSLNMKNDLKVSAEYLDRVVPGKIDKQYVKTTVSGSGTILVLDHVKVKLELDHIVMRYPNVLPQYLSGDYTERKGKVSFGWSVVPRAKVNAYCGINMKESKSDVHKWNCGVSIEYRKDSAAKTVASFERQLSIPNKIVGIKVQINWTQQVDKGLSYELTYSLDSNVKESSVGVCVKHSM